MTALALYAAAGLLIAAGSAISLAALLCCGTAHHQHRDAGLDAGDEPMPMPEPRRAAVPAAVAMEVADARA